MKLLVPAAAGLEAPVKRELKRLGYGDCPAVDGRIRVEGDFTDIARLNVFLRTGERVLLCLGEFSASTFDELYEGVRALPFEEFLTAHSRILIDGKCVKSALMAVKVSGGVVKKAVLNRLREKLGVSAFDEKGARAIVGFTIIQDKVTVTLDTSGDGLHKRGYRTIPYEAPLRETTAAALLDCTFFHAEKPLADLFCGSGTIPIEAAMIARKIAAGASRGFDFTEWKGVPNVLPLALEEARDLRAPQKKPQIFACDISPKAIETAKYHARRAGVEDCIEFRKADVKEFSCAESYGILLSNPPYGERLGKQDDLFALYSSFSRTFRRLPDWSCYMITAYGGAERAFGKKADKNRKLYNADLECYFYSYLGAKPPKREFAKKTGE